MIPGDLTAELARVLAAQVAAGALPPAAATRTANGTWRPARPPRADGPPRADSPPRAGGPPGSRAAPATPAAGPGSYSTSLPLELASLISRAPQAIAPQAIAAQAIAPPALTAEAIAAQLGEQLSRVSWISLAGATDSFLTVTVTRAHLARLPARIVAAGPASARSDALADTALTATDPPDLATASSWATAWRAHHTALVGRLGESAGAQVRFLPAERYAVVGSPSTSGLGRPSVAADYFGADAVRFALAAAATPRPAAIERQLGRPLDLTNPFVRIRYAHADAASTLRWAADLRLASPATPVDPAADATTLHPAELRLLDALSWLAERVAAACRRRRPADLVAYLDDLADAWLVCSRDCSALPFRGRGAAVGPSAAVGAAAIAARLELADAVRVTLAAGLGLLGVAAPAMM